MTLFLPDIFIVFIPKGKVPRIDINAPTNAIEYHPALLAHAEDGCNNGTNSGNGGSSTNTNTYTGGVIDRSFTYISSNHRNF